jgi:hypothetical protein
VTLPPWIVPPSAFGFLNSQPLGRINYGTDLARAAQSDPFAGDDIDNHFMRFLFHDGRTAALPGILGRFAVTVDPTCVFPFTHASALQVNLAMLAAAELDGVLYWDSPLQPQLLGLKRRRMERAAIATVDVRSPAPELRGDSLDMEFTLLYREALQETLGPWKDCVRRFASLETPDAAAAIVSELRAEAARATTGAADIHQELFGQAADSSPSGAALTGQLSVGPSLRALLAHSDADAHRPSRDAFLTLIEGG